MAKASLTSRRSRSVSGPLSDAALPSAAQAAQTSGCCSARSPAAPGKVLAIVFSSGMWVVDKPVGFREPFEVLLIADGDTSALDRNAIGLQSLEGAAQVLRRHAEIGRQAALLEFEVEFGLTADA